MESAERDFQRKTLSFGYSNFSETEGWSTANKLKPASNFISGRPKAALLSRLFSGFRCLDVVCGNVLLFFLDIK